LNLIVDSMLLLAQGTTPGTNGTAPGGTPPTGIFQMLMSMGPLILIVVVMWVLLIGGKRKEQKQRDKMLSELKKGDKVETIGGIHGTVLEVRDGEVVVKVDESSNTKLKFSRRAIHRVISEEAK
jgi:preprotein translocase subunit YajC